MYKKRFYLAFTTLFLFLSCSDDSDVNTETDESEEMEETDTNEDEDVSTYILVELTNNNSEVYLMNQDGEQVYNFDIDYEIGNDANLLDDGSLVYIAKADNPQIRLGGFGGRFVKQNADRTIEWEFEYSSEDEISHHDVEYLSNGNILFLVWEKIEATEAQNAGFSGDFDIYPDAIIEMNPETQEVIWEWHTMDHIVQEFDSTKENYGIIAENPNKVDVNYTSNQTDGDITHANGITLDEENDLLYVTVNYFNEVWVIDHSTTISEAATSSGGNYGLGGDLVYRFGNPDAYNNIGEVTLNRVHYPNLLESGNILVYGNQENVSQSEAIEYQLPENLTLEAGVDNEPEIVWSFTDQDMFSNIISGAVRMDNGNTLIAEGAGILWEVTNEGEIAWQYQVSNGGLWRAYVFYSDDPAIEALNITIDE